MRVDESLHESFLNDHVPFKREQELKYPLFCRYQVEAVECILQYILKQSSNEKDQKKILGSVYYKHIMGLESNLGAPFPLENRSFPIILSGKMLSEVNLGLYS